MSDETAVNVFTLGGACCSIAVAAHWSVKDLKERAAGILDLPGGQASLLSGCQTLLDKDLLPSGVVDFVIINRPRPSAEVWQHWIDRVKSSRWSGSQKARMEELENQLPEMLTTFGEQFALDLIANDSCDELVLEALPKRLYSNRKVMLAAVEKFPSSLRLASESLRADRRVVLAAVSQPRRGCPCCEPLALAFVSEELRADPEVALSAVSWEPDAEMFVSCPDLRRYIKHDFAQRHLDDDYFQIWAEDVLGVMEKQKACRGPTKASMGKQTRQRHACRTSAKEKWRRFEQHSFRWEVA